MIPIRDTIPSHRVAWVTRGLLLANILAFLLELQQGASLERFIYRFGVVPSHWLISSPSDFWDWPHLFLTLLTSQFLHGGLFHLASNMLYLWIFADNVEDRLGHGRFLLLYLGSGVLAAVAQLLLSSHSSVPMVGASGAIAGVLGAYLLMFPTARIITLIPLGWFLERVELPAFLFLGLWFLMQWFQGLMTIGQVADVGGVAFWAHIGGFVAGMAGVLLIRPRRQW
ncbi:MAG: rhomboid family intramembrane serine protease [Candidatus Omnitrophica bacterium CG11_big_fil_rev_8_21_14_0_20_63_9]|nr:MAG: rhomboid family intramembrane serine protease [Candidatus Omnitrophica bacterium CG11_big_fil_rev_8_21_14_0_20_63_9]